MRALTFVEIDVPFCSLSYGTAPCEAALGVTGEIKCFNGLASCQDRDNFDPEARTIRFSVPSGFLPNDIDALPYIKNVDVTPATISLGSDLGQRAEVKIVFDDHPHSDAGFDKYLSDRDYDPYQRGTFWGKFRNRLPYLQGRPLRLIRGEVGQSISEMETRHYIVESYEGPTPAGEFTIIAQDILKLADNDRALAPRLSGGVLLADIDDGDTTAHLSPSGIGNAEYPSSGYLAIGGKELCSFTRSGDTLTLNRFASYLEFDRAPQEHKAGDRVQVVIRYEDESPADIIYDLLVSYAGVDPAFIDLSAWQNEIDTYFAITYSTFLVEPTGVNTLLSELIEHGLSLWWSDTEQTLRLRVLRGVITLAQRFTEDNTLEGSLEIEDQPDKRISRVVTYFGQVDPFESVDKLENYRVIEETVDEEAEQVYDIRITKTITCRWLPATARTFAQKINRTQLSRFASAPRRFSLRVSKFTSFPVALGNGYRLASRVIQDMTGAASDAAVQVTRLSTTEDAYVVEAEEALFKVQDPGDLTDRVITIESDALNFNLRGQHDSIYPAITDSDVGYVTLTCIINTGVIVGSASTALRSFTVGDWPEGFEITIRVLGRIQGAGGDGGSVGLFSAENGSAGGPALYTRFPIDLEVDEGEIWGGGGGGAGFFFGLGGFPGGGGAGQLPGLGDGTPGITEAGGAAPGGANGGDPGMPGANGLSTTGGAAGAAIDGISYVTVTAGPGDRRGPEVN